MNKSFLKFNEAALKSGLLQLNPVLAQQLKNVTESFVSLAKSAAERSDEEEVASEPVDLEPPLTKTTEPTQSQPVDVGWGYTTSFESQSPPHRPTQSPIQDVQHQDYNHIPLLPNFNTEQAKEGGMVQYRRPQIPDVFNQGVSWAHASLGERPSDQPLPFGLVDILSDREFKPPNSPNTNVYSVNIPTLHPSPPVTRLTTPPYLSISAKSPKPAWTYSHDETTFARRLTRAALETGFHLLSSASQRPAALEYVFRLSLPYMTLNELRERFKILLARGTDEELDCWETPFLHLGGAGTHYPRKDANGNIIKMLNTWTVRRIGPLEKKMLRAESSDDPNQSHDLNVDLTGFEGKWFDAHDVEGYLEQEKGVRIDPRNSFQDALVDDDEQDDYFNLNAGADTLTRRLSDDSTPSFSTGSSTTDTRSSISTPPHAQAVNNGNLDDLFASSDISFGLDMSVASEFHKAPAMDSSAFYEQPLGLDLAPGFDVGVNNAPLPTLNFSGESGSMMDMPFQNAEQMPVVRQRRKKAVLIDVSKLIDGESVLMQCACTIGDCLLISWQELSNMGFVLDVLQGSGRRTLIWRSGHL